MPEAFDPRVAAVVSEAVSHIFNMRYYSLNRYCRDTFGEKLYKLSLDGGMTCPNRDGTLSSLGCLYCSAGGSGDFAANRNLSIKEQLSAAREKVVQRAAVSTLSHIFRLLPTHMRR